MPLFLKSKLIATRSIGLLKISPFLAKIQEKNKSSSRFFSAIGTLRQKFDYSSGEEIQSLIAHQNFGSLNSTEVLNTLGNLRTKPFVAFAYFKNCENYGFRHDISTYTMMIAILSNWNRKGELMSLFSNIISSNNDSSLQISYIFSSLVQTTNRLCLDSFILDALFMAYITCKRDPQEAITQYFHLVNLGFVSLVRSCNVFFNFVAKNCDLGTLCKVLDQMREFGINLDVYSFEILIKSLFDAKKPDDAIRVFRLMEEAGVKPNGSIFNMVICGFCNESRFEEAENLLETMFKQHVPPDQVTYGYLIEAYYEKGNFFKALDIYRKMSSRGVEPRPITASHLLQSLRKLGMNSEVLVFFKGFKKSGIVMDKVLYNMAVDIHCRLGLMKEAMELIQEMRINGLDPDTTNYTCLIAGFCHKGEIVDAQKVFAEMIKWSLKPDLITYNVLLSGFSKNGRVDEVHDLLERMSVQGIEPSINTYCLVIEGFCKGGRVGEAEVVFKILEQNDSIDKTGQTRLFSSMISGYLCQGYTARAHELFRRFSEDGNLIDKVSCRRLVCELCNEGNVASACNVVNVMVNKHQVVPDEFSYGKLIAAFCQMGDLDGARFWLEHMLNNGLSANMFICTTLMDGYCKAGQLDNARQLFDEMTHAGMKPDVVAYTVLLDGHLKEVLKQILEKANETRKFETKARICHLARCMEEHKIERDVICYTVLIDGQCKMKRLSEAQQLFDEMLSKGWKPDVPIYTALINGYCIQGKIEQAKKLFQEMVDSGLKPDKLAFSVWGKVIRRGREMQMECWQRI